MSFLGHTAVRAWRRVVAACCLRLFLYAKSIDRSFRRALGSSQQARLRPAVFNLLLLASSQVFCPSASAQVGPVRRTLIISEMGRSSADMATMDGEIQRALEKTSYQIELYTENLDADLFPDDTSQHDIREWIVHKYRNLRPDLIIAVGLTPLKFLAESRDRFSPGTPVVFCGSPEDLAGYPKLESSFTGVWGVLQPERTLDAALHLLPKTQHVIVAGGVAPNDRLMEASIKERLKSYESNLDFTYLTDLAMPALLDRLGHLPGNSIVLLATMMEDSTGMHFIYASQAVPLLAKAANAPVFVMSDVAVDAGTVGGDVESFANQGRIAAGIAVRILNGESPENIPIVRDTGIYEFDWRALKRWGLKETDLPSGSLVIDHQLSVWQAYWRYILAGILLLLAQVLIILALLWQRAKKRKISSELALSNHRLSLAMASGKSVGWESDLATGCDYLFGDLRAVFGIPSDTHRAPVGDFYRYIHPEDLQRVSEAMNDAKKNRTPYFQEFRLLSPDGATRWVASRGTFEYAPNGKPVRMTGLVFDITERKEIEEALKNSEEKFSKAFRESPLVLTLTSTKDHRYIDVNDTFEKITGWKREEAIGRTPLDLGLWVDSAQRLKFNKRLLAEGSVRNHESDFRMKDGQIRIGLGATELIDIHGEPCALSVIADITEAKLAEQERQVSERRFSQFFETLPEYSYLISLDGNILDANSAACKALGYSKKELIGKNISDVYAPESNSRMIDLLKKWRETGRLYNEEMVVLTKQGKRRIVLLNAGSVTDAYGNLQYFTSVQVDVTDRKEMELLLQENQGRLAAIVGSAMDAIIAIDQFQRIIVFNVAAEKMFGCSARDAIGTPIQRFIPQRFHGRDGEHIRNFGKTGATGKASGGLGTLWALRANGEEFPIEVSTAQFEVSGKEIFTIIIRDITERRQAEEALSNMSRKLIEAQEEERTRLARELHDDINQRIALLSVMLKHAIQELPAEAVEARQRMEDLCDRALSISTGIQALSHRLHSSKLDYLGLKTAAAGFCREFSDQHGVAIDFRSDEIPKTLPKEVSLCLFRVLQEALQNSAKHSGSSHVRVTMENTQKELRLTVEDSGKGFDPEMAMKGTGVGLTNMKERMKLVRGELSIESQPGKGTVIRATAPLDRAAKSAQVAT